MVAIAPGGAKRHQVIFFTTFLGFNRNSSLLYIKKEFFLSRLF